MTIHPSNFVTLSGLTPLLNDRFLQLSASWQSVTKAGSLELCQSEFADMAKHYHALYGFLTVAKLPELAQLAYALEQCCYNLKLAPVDAEARRALGAFTHRVLHHELTRFVLTGQLWTPLLVVSSEQILAGLPEASDINTVDQLGSDFQLLKRSFNGGATSSHRQLSLSELDKLLVGWRRSVSQYLSDQEPKQSLKILQKIAQYLWESSTNFCLQNFWYLAQSWLTVVCDEGSIALEHFTPLASRLDQVIQATLYAGREVDLSLVEAEMIDEHLKKPSLERIAVELWVSLGRSAEAHQHKLACEVVNQLIVLSPLKKDGFSQILSEIETLGEKCQSFELGEAKIVNDSLQQIKLALQHRGWLQHSKPINQIIQNIEQSLLAPTLDVNWQHQIKRQFQDLTAALVSIQQVISDQVSRGASKTKPSQQSPLADATSTKVSQLKSEQLQGALTTIQKAVHQSFGQNKPTLLPDAEPFETITQTFKALSLPQAYEMSTALATMFSDWRLAAKTKMSPKFVETIADTLILIEWLIKALSHQIVATTLLNDIQQNIHLAAQLLTQEISADSSGNPSSEQTATLANQSQSQNIEKLESVKKKTSKSQLLSQTPTKRSVHSHQLDDRKIDDNTPIAAEHNSAVAKQTEDKSDNAAAGISACDSAVLASVRAKLQDDSFDVDDEIREIFIEEAEEVLVMMASQVPQWRQHPQDTAPLTDIRRGYHTLKGSGRMVGAFNAAESAWAFENMLNRILDNTIAVSQDIIDLVADHQEVMATLVKDFAQKQPPSIDPAVAILKSHNILADRPIYHGLEALATTDEGTLGAKLTDSAPDVAADSQNLDTVKTPDRPLAKTEGSLSSLSADNSELPEVLEPFMVAAETMKVDTKDADPDIKGIFIEEAQEVLETITPLFTKYQSNLEDTKILTEVRRGFHTLKGSGRMVGANYSAELAWAIENMLNHVLAQTIKPTTEMMQLVADVLAAYPDLVTIFASGRQEYPKSVKLWVACAHAFSQGLGEDFSYKTISQHIQAINNSHVGTKSDLAQVDDSAKTHTTEELVVESTESQALAAIDAINQKAENQAKVVADAVQQSLEEQNFCEIFIAEAQEHLKIIKSFLAEHQADLEIEVEDEIVRAFHTLRGAAGSECFAAVSEISSAVEHSLEQLQLNDAMMNEDHLKAISRSVDLIERQLAAFTLVDQHHITSDQHQKEVQSIQALLESPQGDQEKELLTVAQLISDSINDLLDAEWELESQLTAQSLTQVANYAQTIADQIKQLQAVTGQSKKFQRLLTALLTVYDRLITEPELSDVDRVVTVLLAAHGQLTGLFDSLAAGMTLKVDESVILDLHSIAGLTVGLESEADEYYSDFPPSAGSPPQSSIEDDNKAVSSLPDRAPSDSRMAKTSLETKKGSSLLSSSSTDAALASQSANKTLAKPQNEAAIETITADEELLEIFLEEALELDADITQAFLAWRENFDDKKMLKALQRHLHTIKGGARMAGIKSIGDLTHEAETVYEYFVTDKLSPSLGWIRVMQVVQDTLSAQIDFVAKHRQSFFADDLVEALKEFITQEVLADDTKIIVSSIPERISEPEPHDDQADISALQSEAVEEHDYQWMTKESWQGNQPDSDILAVFLDEAKELSESSQQYLQKFRSNTSDVSALQSLQRELHTIKGGARMVSANGVADLAHQMETVYETLASRQRPATKKVAQLLEACHNWLTEALFVLSQRINPPRPKQLIASLAQFLASPDELQAITADSLKPQLETIADYKLQLREAKSDDRDISTMPPMTGGFGESEVSVDVSNEMIRVSAGLIEQMINLSGESAINRARIDMGMSGLTSSISEMGTTVQRLADQLRRMDIELEAQILSQIDDEEMIANAEFDPLEMDQYSALNQLSKSLSESASDLLDIKSTLLEKTRDTESLLLQLSRTQAELQDGLMSSRMVPFSRLVPRLQRIVRQTASELNKSVELTVVNADDEMDRTILERITSPLEHMLRNAVDHGIEPKAERLTADKPETGQIKLEVLREGGEVVIHLTDDGSGISVDAVRNKAISLGLIDPNDTSLSDVDVMQYIFNSGLTTTKKLTQISGRGVGMDVVRSEIHQLGGVVTVSSEAGVGSCFTIRVPLTVAVSDALVVRAADRYYAIPLVQIERVVRIDPEALYAYYQSDQASFKIGDTDYRVRYLNEILTGHTLSDLMVSANASLPVIIVKTQSDQSLAIQVDEIAGSRIEVVVKPLGRQLSYVSGISAATIMGDGSVMLILDLIALMRNAAVQSMQSARQNVTPASDQITSLGQDRPTILVVDDSVTVRKVTSRFLDRQGFITVVAKDGVDAMERLQELTPDLILLDIEMPRMDGFEMATQVRHHRRLASIPIIMVTSRTGEKHRKLAFEIGVNAYMGKPFQENELLNQIELLLGESVGDQQDD